MCSLLTQIIMYDHGLYVIAHAKSLGDDASKIKIQQAQDETAFTEVS